MTREDGIYDIVYAWKVSSLTTGDEFGELALINSEPRAATVITSTPTYFATLDRAAFFKILRTSEIEKNNAKIDHLDNYKIFQHFSKSFKSKLYKFLRQKDFIKDQIVYKEGDPVDDIYCIVEGTFEIYK